MSSAVTDYFQGLGGGGGGGLVWSGYFSLSQNYQKMYLTFDERSSFSD